MKLCVIVRGALCDLDRLMHICIFVRCFLLVGLRLRYLLLFDISGKFPRGLTQVGHSCLLLHFMLGVAYA